MWHPIETAPLDRDLELAVIDATGTCTLVVPCRRGTYGWINMMTNAPTHVRPTHWREWNERLRALDP